MFGFSGNLNVNVGGLGDIGGKIGGGFFGGGSSGTSGGSTSKTTTTTTSSSSSSNSYEVKLREQYETKINGYELKLKEQNTQISQYDKTLREYELKIKESEKRLNSTRLELTEKFEFLLREKNTLTVERESFNVQLDNLRKENFQLKQTVVQYEANFTSFNEKIRFLENDRNLKVERMKEMENKLITATNEINQSLSIDVSQEEQLRQQREMIMTLTNELERMKIEDAAEDIKFAEMEVTIKTRNEEIALLRKQIEDLNDKLLLADTNFNVETSEVYVQLEGRYNETVTERDQLNVQINIKINQIRDLENRISSNTQKITNLTRTIEDLRSQFESYESRELDNKRLLSEYEVKLNIAIKETSQRDNKIASYENVVKSKDSKISQLTELIKTRDIKIAQFEKNIEEGKSAVNDLKIQLEKRLLEISEWKAEDARDNAQIAELLKSVQDQNETIKRWEEENARDDARIAELERTVEEKDAIINRLKDFIFSFRSKFLDMRNTAFSLEIVDETQIQERVSSISTEVTQSEQYKSLEFTVSQKDAEISRLREEINHYREQVTKAYAAKNQAIVDLERLQAELEAQRQIVNTYNVRITEFESKISSYSKRVETETTTTMVAHTKIDNFKSSVQATTEEVDALFIEIETLLAEPR